MYPLYPKYSISAGLLGQPWEQISQISNQREGSWQRLSHCFLKFISGFAPRSLLSMGCSWSRDGHNKDTWAGCSPRGTLISWRLTLVPGLTWSCQTFLRLQGDQDIFTFNLPFLWPWFEVILVMQSDGSSRLTQTCPNFSHRHFP